MPSVSGVKAFIFKASSHWSRVTSHPQNLDSSDDKLNIASKYLLPSTYYLFPIKVDSSAAPV